MCSDGGAVLVAAGPDYASSDSIFRTPLEAVLPAEPTGNVTERPFHARLTEAGRRHPVTRALDGAAFDPPRWSRFFRVVDADATPGAATLLGAPDDRPLLVLAREGEGRVALMLSDHIWLWARGFEGGGPHLDLLRRLSHWLMKEPELEEERLRLLVRGRGLVVERQSMTDSRAAGDADLAVRPDPHGDADEPPSPASGAPRSRRASSACGGPPTARCRRWSMSGRSIRARCPRSPAPPRCWRRSAKATGGGVIRIADTAASSCRACWRSAAPTASPALTGSGSRTATPIR